MSNWNDYRREEAPRLEAGDYRVEIVDVEEATSKSSGNPMIIVTIKPNGSNIKIKHYIVKNDWFNRNMTELFDSFNIDEGDFNFVGWIGAVGAARLKEDENGYLKVAWFIKQDKADKLPAWVGEMPERQTVTDFEAVETADDLPWEE